MHEIEFGYRTYRYHDEDDLAEMRDRDRGGISSSGPRTCAIRMLSGDA